MKASRWTSVLVAGLFGLLVYLHARDQGPLIDEPAPPFALPIVHGEGASSGDRMRLEDLRGSFVVLDFWASWCGPCRESIPILNRVARELASSGVRVVGVNAEGHGPERAGLVADRWGIAYPVLYDATAAVQNAYEVRALPSLFLVDRKGIVRRAYAGSPGAEQLIREIRELDR